ncbi:receptor-type tyrosine-protein phosphatase mu-like [Physella acuta]|uniref:receptor-type tyrosine-protein phosphatase mu-like n=1 Tax=Physella acuta TaxID=109671 RepID=UPI0027DAE251|nr:receptor-type tyrosine-protein phosphatase mu-like [Physella acuta]
MLTNLIEEGKVKCDRYWPEDGKMMFGDIKVKLAVTHVFADYTIRRLLLSKKGTDVQQVTQFHFTSWPDKGVPITPWALVDFEQRVAFNPTSRPVVVHCSAGVGRTGTFIALRNVMREAEETGRVNFLQTVARLRQDRMNMVQTAEQYEFLHKAAQVAITCIGTTITAYDVDVKVQNLLDKSVSGKTNLEKEFNSVCAVSADLQTAGKEEEKEMKVYENNQDVDLMRKNRCPEIMPNRLYQAKLSRSRPEDSDYINAVVFPSFTKLEHQLLTQLPLPTTVEDFWRLIVEYNVTLVVVFDVDLCYTTWYSLTLGHYLPASANEMLNIRDYTVELKSSNTHTLWEEKTVVVRTMGPLQLKSFNTQDGHTVLHLQSKLTTLDTKTLLQFIKQTRKHANKKGRVIYMCRDGATYSGLVCVLNLLLDRMDNDLRLAVPLVVGAVKSIRPQVIPTLQQYHCLYQVLQRYSDTTTTYSNLEKKSEKLIQHLDNNVEDNVLYANTE